MSENRDRERAICEHADPLVLDGRSAWCAECGALFGMGKWRTPEQRTEPPSPREPRDLEEIGVKYQSADDLGLTAKSGGSPNSGEVQFAPKNAELLELLEGARCLSNPIGPLYGAGWNAAIDCVIERVKAHVATPVAGATPAASSGSRERGESSERAVSSPDGGEDPLPRCLRPDENDSACVCCQTRWHRLDERKRLAKAKTEKR